MTNKEDLRIVKTKRNIENTFLKLLCSHTFEQITVKQILEEALISKGTFYAHYLDKYDLAEKIVTNTLQEFQNGIQERLEGVLSKRNRQSFTTSLLKALHNTIPQLNLLKKIHTDKIDVQRSMHDIITAEYLLFQKQKGANLEHPALRAHIVAVSVLGFLSWKESHPLENSLEEYLTEAQQIFNEYGEWIKEME